MSQAFYKLTPDEWLEVTKILKYADVRVLYYLRTLDPFGDRDLDIKVTEVAEATGLTKGTVSKSLKNLDNNGFIRMGITQAVVRLSSKAFSEGNDVSCGTSEFPTERSGFLQETCESYRKPENPTGNFRRFKRLSRASLGVSQTIKTKKTNQTFLDNAKSENEKVADLSQSEPATQPLPTRTVDQECSTPQQESGLGTGYSEDFSSVAKFEQGFNDRAANILPRWRTGRGRNDWNEGLLQEYIKRANEKYAGQKTDRGDAVAYFSNAEIKNRMGEPGYWTKAEALVDELERRIFERKEREAFVELAKSSQPSAAFIPYSEPLDVEANRRNAEMARQRAGLPPRRRAS